MRSGGMMAPVEENISDAIASLAGTRERTSMVAIAEHAPLASGESIQPPSNPDLERPQSTRERPPIRSLDNQMQMRVLEREVNDAKIFPTIPSIEERSLHRAKLELRPKR